MASAPLVLVPVYGYDSLPFASSFKIRLFEFCANSMPPSAVAIGPSALLPVPVQTVFHVCPAAMTPEIAATA